MDDYLFEEFYDNLEQNEKSSTIVSYLRDISIRITDLEIFNEYLIDLIPLKYKKFHVKPGENPFFSKEDIQPSQEDIQKAKERMRSLLEKAKEKS